MDNTSDKVFRLIDEAMTLLEQLEEDVATMAEEKELRGVAYRMYTRIIQLTDKLRELRVIVFEECKQ